MGSSNAWLWVFRAGVGFLLLAALLFLLGFATDHWYDDDVEHYGLWNSCTETGCSTIKTNEIPAYRIATQAFQIFATVLFALSPILHLIFYCSKKRKDTGWRSRILDVGYSVGTIFHLGSLLIFGLENSRPENFSWSYKMSCASSAIAIFGIIMIVISRKKALSKFSFRAVNRNKRKTASTLPNREDRFAVPSVSPARSPLPNSTETSSAYTPAPNVNITLNINSNPPQSNSSFPSSPSAQTNSNHQPTPSSYITAQHSVSNNPPSINGHQDQSGSFQESEPVSDHILTQVRPAPKSSISHYSSPVHRKQFGPADRNRTFESIDKIQSFDYSGSSTIPTISITTLPDNAIQEPHQSISSDGLPHKVVPSAPSYDNIQEDDIPPPYSEVVSTNN